MKNWSEYIILDEKKSIEEIKFAIRPNYSKTIRDLVPLFYSLALGGVALSVINNSLWKSNIFKRRYYKRNKRYWKKHDSNKCKV